MKYSRFKTVFDSIFLQDLVSASDIVANTMRIADIDELTQDATFYKREFRPKIGEMVDVEYRGEVSYRIEEKMESGFLLVITFLSYDGRRDECAKVLFSTL